MTSIWFPEPSAVDDSLKRGEQPSDWLSRSTLPRAKGFRRFLNDNISQLPKDAQSNLFKAIHHRHKSAFFELIVARTLQILGATLTVEPKQDDNKQPDFLAQFPDSTIIVEAASPNFSVEAGQKLKNRNPLTDIIEALVPEGWSVGILKIPRIGQADSKKALRQTVTRMLSISPPTDGTTELDLVEELPSGIIHLHLVSRRPNWPPIAWEAPFTVFDNSKKSFRKTVQRKRRQVRNSKVPVLLAIEGSWLGNSLENFDMALYGHTCDVINQRMEREATKFIPNGLFTNVSDKPPIYAGVLAFPEVGFKSVAAPVLYQHPRFKRYLPEALSGLEQRWYEDGMGVDSIKTRQASSANLLESLGFIRE